MYKAQYLSPMIPSFDLKKTSDFFTSLLNFEIYMDSDTYKILCKDNLTIHFLRAGEDIGQMEFYLEVDNVDKLWEGIKNRIHGLRFKEPFDREYGMRELHIEVPSTKTLLFIGSVIKKPIN